MTDDAPAGAAGTTRTRTATGPADGPDPRGRARGARRAGRGAAPRRVRTGSRWTPYVLVAPFFVFFGAFGVFPLAATAWASLYRMELTAPDERQWVGVHNYARLADDTFFWNALVNTVTIGVLATVPQLLLALGVAHLLDVRLRGRGVFRVVALAPYATSVAAATLVFALFFGRDHGMANWALGLAGLDPVDWQNGPWASKFAVASIVIWRWTGYNALIYLAAMQTVPPELYEAASLDGASRWGQFLHVTLPGLRPAIAFTVLVSTRRAAAVRQRGGRDGRRGPPVPDAGPLPVRAGLGEPPSGAGRGDRLDHAPDPGRRVRRGPGGAGAARTPGVRARGARTRAGRAVRP